MSRNYKKEWKKEKESKVSRLIKIDKDIFEEFKNKLDLEGKSINGFVNEQIKKYLEKE